MDGLCFIPVRLHMCTSTPGFTCVYGALAQVFILARQEIQRLSSLPSLELRPYLKTVKRDKEEARQQSLPAIPTTGSVGRRIATNLIPAMHNKFKACQSYKGRLIWKDNHNIIKFARKRKEVSNNPRLTFQEKK